jgi:hypothetical protein
LEVDLRGSAGLLLLGLLFVEGEPLLDGLVRAEFAFARELREFGHDGHGFADLDFTLG